MNEFNFRGRGDGHFNGFYRYNRFVDYDTNAESFDVQLGRINYYLHYLDHLLLEIQEVLNDLLDRVTELERYKHVPAILVDHNPSPDYLTVGNETRTDAVSIIDGSPLTDLYKQQHFIDTTNLDKAINDLKAYKHVPAILVNHDSNSEYISVGNENRPDFTSQYVAPDGTTYTLHDTYQQQHFIDTTKLDNIIDELKSYEHVPSKLDHTSSASGTTNYISTSNSNRTDVSPLTDTTDQHHIVDTTKLDNNLNEIWNIINDLANSGQIRETVWSQPGSSSGYNANGVLRRYYGSDQTGVTQWDAPSGADYFTFNSTPNVPVSQAVQLYGLITSNDRTGTDSAHSLSDNWSIQLLDIPFSSPGYGSINGQTVNMSDGFVGSGTGRGQIAQAIFGTDGSNGNTPWGTLSLYCRITQSLKIEGNTTGVSGDVTAYAPGEYALNPNGPGAASAQNSAGEYLWNWASIYKIQLTYTPQQP